MRSSFLFLALLPCAAAAVAASFLARRDGRAFASTPWHALPRGGGAKAKDPEPEENGVLDKIKGAFTRAGTKAKEIDEEHKVREKTKKAASDVGAKTIEAAKTTAAKAKQLEEKHQVTEKTRKAASRGWTKTKEVASDVGAKTSAKAKQLDAKHGVSEKTKRPFVKGWTKVKELDEEHQVSKKTRKVASDVSAKTAELERKHHYGESFLAGVRDGADSLIGKLKNLTGQLDTNESSVGGNETAEA